MKHSPIRRCIVLVLLLGLPLAAHAQAQNKKIITLGADLNPDQRKALLQRFGANEATDKILTINSDETRNTMQTIIPLPQGYTSVSSTALTCLPPGGGLHVTSENITKVSAAMYASALLTAGIGDADLIVAAPQDAQAEGMSALAGVFKGFTDPVCNRGELNPTRRDLALRQLALTADLATTTGGDYTKAADFMLRAQQVLVREKNNPDAAYPIVDGVQNDTGIKLPPEQRKAVAEQLAAMGQAKIDWGTYAAGWDLQKVSDNDVRVTPKNIGGAAAGSAAPAGGTAAGQTYDGTVASTAPLRITVPGNLPHLELNGNTVKVVRNDKPATLSDIQPNDTVTVTVGPNNIVQRIVAQSGVPGAANSSLGRGISSSTTGIAARIRGLSRYWWLCLIPLLLLLLLFLVRRRRGDTLLVTPGRRRLLDPEEEEDLLG
ncbi:MAG: DUF1002 domain-containing protein [Herpetosiphonaceae bacterium]|nr:DUF1002 domain-containing protein [Herpetosiphonaceae bacterium]